MHSAYTIVAINDDKTLLLHRDAILELFALCFGHSMSPDLWTWAYQKNPSGSAYVHLAYKGKELVGHYAMIPQQYCNNAQPFIVTLSMTTMVHPAHRRAGLFNILAEGTYAHAKKSGVQAVIGFPNSKSAPGFKKRLQWACDDHYHIVKTDVIAQNKSSLFRDISKQAFQKNFQCNDKSLLPDFSQAAVLNWRLSKPGTDYTLLTGEKGELLIVKPYADILDVVYSNTLGLPPGLHDFAQAHGHSSLVTFSNTRDAAHSDNSETTQYRFGFRNFQPNSLAFSPQLIMSDVF